nr:PREDICTED: nucleoporin Nup37 [Lepisosteus oculatus]
MKQEPARSPSYALPCEDYVHVVEFSPFESGSPASLIAYGGNQFVVVGTCRFQEEDTEVEGVEYCALRMFLHGVPVQAIAWSPESRLDSLPQQIRLCTAGADKKLRLLTSDLRERSDLRVMEGHTNYINHLNFEPREGKQIASVSDDHTCRVWELDGSQSASFLLRSPGMSVCWHPEEAFKVGTINKCAMNKPRYLSSTFGVVFKCSVGIVLGSSSRNTSSSDPEALHQDLETLVGIPRKSRTVKAIANGVDLEQEWRKQRKRFVIPFSTTGSVTVLIWSCDHIPVRFGVNSGQAELCTPVSVQSESFIFTCSYPQEKRPAHVDCAQRFRWSRVNEKLFATTGYPGKINSQLLIHHLGHPQPVMIGSASVGAGLSWHRTLPLCVIGGDRKLLFWMTEM